MAHSRRRLCFGILLLLLGSVNAALRADTTPYRYFTASDGLPSEHVKALAQTPDGLLWIGTAAGVVVYDGQSFRAVPLPEAIGARSVPELHPLSDGTVWVAPSGGGAVRVNAHGGVQGSFLFGTTVYRILARDDTLLFATHEAIWRLPPGAARPVRRDLRYDVRAPARVSDFPHSGTGVVDAGLAPDGSLWILDGHRGPGHVQADGSVAFADVPRAKPGPRWWQMRFDSTGRMLLCRDDTLYRFTPATGALRALRTDVDGPIYLDDGAEGPFVAWDRHVLQYAPEHSWESEIPSLRTVLRTQPGLPDLTPFCMLRDREGGIWIGTRTGLFQLPHPSVRHVRAVKGTSIAYPGAFLESEGTLWMSTWGSGLFQLRPRRRVVTPGTFTHWSQKLQSLDPNIHARARDQWYTWTAARGWHRVNEAEHAVRGVVGPDGVGYFWHDDGLYRHSPDAGTEPVELASWSPDGRDAHMVAMAPDTSLFVRHEEVILRIRRTDGYPLDTLAHVPEIDDARGRYMTVDAEGRIWMALYGAGLVCVDPDGPPQLRRVLDGVPMENVRISGDSLVLASAKDGLYLVDFDTGRVRQHLTASDGLHATHVKAAHLANDTLYVGHPRGLTLLPRSRLFPERSSPHAILSGLEVNLEERSLLGDSVFAAAERSVGFSFAGTSLSRPEQVRYEVRLSPQDTAWHSTTRGFTRYTNLAPGTYRFEVRAALDARPPGPAAEYAFTIPPYWYETYWFVLGVAGLLLLLGGGGVRWRLQRLRRRQHELASAVQDRTEALTAEKEKTEEQARRLMALDEAKNRFFANVSHEFRTPLTLILQPVRDALQSGADDPVPVPRRHLLAMDENAQRLRRLIDQLLDLATLEAGRMTLDPRRGDLVAFVRRVADAFTSLVESQGLTLEMRRPEGPIDTTFDPDKMEKVVANLLSNALKFTPEDGRVTVSIECDGTEVVLRVRDTGVGIPQDRQGTIFDRFEQADDTSTREQEGTGLGLAVAREFVELHDGHISVDSTPGEGSTFTVRLPLRPDAEAPPLRTIPRSPVRREEAPTPSTESPADSASPAAPEVPVVLVVEDNDAMRRYVRDQLDDAYSVLEAETGRRGWERVQNERPDLVLCDVMMPEMDGFELCRRVKADDELRAIPVILLTARAETKDAVEGLDCGADDYLTKPFDVDELRRRIDNHLSTRRFLRDRYRQEIRVEPTDTVAAEEHVPFLEGVIAVIDEHLDNPDFTVERLADAVALSRRHLSRRLKEAVGASASDFVRKYRMARAAELLDRKPETIAEVAYAVGFRSPSHFASVFRKHFDCSPSAYVERRTHEDDA